MMMPSKPSDANGDTFFGGSSGKPKSYKWLSPRRWKLNGKNGNSSGHQKNAALSPEQERSLEADIKDLAAATGGNKGGGVTLWSVSALQSVTAKGEEPWRISSSPSPSSSLRKSSSEKGISGCALNNDAQIVLVRHNSFQYALKRLPTVAPSKKATGSKKRLATAELVKEAKLLARVGNHPNILALRGLPTVADGFLSSCVNDNAFFFLTDPLHRETLDTRIRTWRQSGVAAAADASSSCFQYTDTRIPDEEMIPRKSSYAYQIAKALQGCHHAGIIVRDLSPLKIGFRRDDPHVVQLFDIGHAAPLAKQESVCATTSPISIVGKRRYMAGEIGRSGEYSKESDVYSWAMIFYEMLAEKKPFHGLTAQEHQKLVCCCGSEGNRQAVSKRPPLQEYCLPQGIESLLGKAWHQTPGMRPSSDLLCQEMQSLVLHLDAVLLYEDEHVVLDPNDFLLEVHVESTTDEDGDDDISELGDTPVDSDDELWAFMHGSPSTAGTAANRPPTSALGNRLVYVKDDDRSTASCSYAHRISNDGSNVSKNKDATESNDNTIKIPSRAPSICTTTLSSGPENNRCKIAPSAA